MLRANLHDGSSSAPYGLPENHPLHHVSSSWRREKKLRKKKKRGWSKKKNAQKLSLKKKILAKAAALRINLYIDGPPIVSQSHTHPSHSQTSRLLTSSLSLGVPVPPTHNPVYVRSVDPSGLDVSLSSHRYSCIGLLFSSCCIA